MSNIAIILKVFVLATVVFAATSCEKIALRNDEQLSNTELFDFLWRDLDERYSFFEEKNIDWDSIRLVYTEKINDELDQFEFFELLGDLMGELQDGHVNLLSTFNRSRNWEWYENYPLNYSHDLIEKYYLKTDFRIVGPLLVQSLDNHLYINYRSFAQNVSPDNIDEIIRLMENHEGVIIDIRSNGGGSLGNAHAIISRFIPQSTTYAFERIKVGPQRDAFSPWIPLTINPSESDRYEGKVAVLINRRTYSAGSFFAQMCKVTPNIQLFGDQTGGGGGVPAFGEMHNGWTYRFSSTQTKDLEDYQIELGVLPDTFVAMDPNALDNGEDNIITAAKNWLKE